MCKMGSHDPFGHLKHKLWPKEGAGVKLAIWLSTTKSWELPWFPCVKVACHILLESSQWELQLYVKPHLNQRSACKIMCLQTRRNPNFGNFGTPNWSHGTKMSFGCWPRGQAHSILLRGKWWLPQVRAVVSLMNPCLPVARSCTKRAQTIH